MKAGSGGVVVLLLSVGLLAAFAGPASSHHYARIQPGAVLQDPCTLNLVFEDAHERLYIGAASHCVPPLGHRVVLPGLGEFGTVVYDAPMTITSLNSGQPQLDFALIAIDAAKYPLVDPSMRAWGGPTGVAADPLPGTVTLHYGQGLIYQSTEATRARTGVMEYVREGGVFDGWWHGAFPVLGGDSGSPVLTAAGEALGFVSTVAITFIDYSLEPAPVGGPTFARVLEWLAADGWDLSIVTAPPADAVAGTQARVAHCQDRPLADPSEPDGCYRPQYHSYHAVTEDRPVRSWHGWGWAAGITSDPALCPRIPYFPWIPGELCHEHILIVDVRPDFWDDHDGSLTLAVDWPPSDGDLDLYVYDMDDQVVAHSATDTPGHESVVVDQPTPDHYRIVLVPRVYSGLPLGGSGQTIKATLAFVAS